MITQDIAKSGLYNAVIIYPEMRVIVKSLIVYPEIMSTGTEQVVVHQRNNGIDKCKTNENNRFCNIDFFNVL